ncbi:MAG: hypothetical protein H0T62_02015 [Parachlamydiaceae bacterium]|nr:hypothetical protein [Parachlamydiaceae bacterium]
MNITKAEYIAVDGHPYLRVIMDGKEAIIGDLKLTVLEMGYVQLESSDKDVNWTEILPPIKITFKDSDQEHILRGFTNDPVIVKMASIFWNAINNIEGEKFKVGPIPIPI